MTRPVIISCALTGAADTADLNPAVPVTPEQIASEALSAHAAGAAIVHIHVRNPETRKASMDTVLYKEVVERIRDAGTDVIINLTTGPGARFVPDRDDPMKVAASSVIESGRKTSSSTETLAGPSPDADQLSPPSSLAKTPTSVPA